MFMAFSCTWEMVDFRLIWDLIKIRVRMRKEKNPNLIKALKWYYLDDILKYHA